MIRTNFLRNGNEVFASNENRVTFSYYIIGDASSTGYVTGGSELRILPQSVMGKKFVAMSYLREPTFMVDENSEVEFPKSFLQTLVEWALEDATVRQGDGPTMNQSAQQDAVTLFNFIA